MASAEIDGVLRGVLRQRQDSRIRKEREIQEKWSGRWDSNPRLDLGKVPYYPYTTTALEQENFITSFARRQDGIAPHNYARVALEIDISGHKTRVTESRALSKFS